nr:yemanuclein-like [Leptinotarsa decemlineata]
MLIDQQMPALEMGFRKRCDDFLKQKFAKDKDDGQIKSQRTPRRQYHWNEQSRKLVKDIWNIKKQCLRLDGKKKDLEELLNQYLRKNILPLWPEGWMYLKSLKNKIENTSDLNFNSTSINLGNVIAQAVQK